MPDIFLSYSREDQATARRFAEGFEKEGFKVWWDQTLRSGENYDQVTERALREAKAVVVLWSKTSVESRWVRAEATQADRLGTLVPAMIEDCTRPIMFELKHTAELAHWQGDARDPAWRAYVGDVRRFVGRDNASPVTGAAVLPSFPKPGRSRRWIAVVAVASTLVVGALLAWPKLHGRSQVSAQPRAVANAAPVTLAVLPFADLSPAKDQEYLADGVAEEIGNSLRRLSGLQVTGRTSAFYFKGRDEGLQQIGEKLGVEYLLEGSVRKSGDALRIKAQLVKASDGFGIWTQTYERSLRDIFSVQDEIARSVANALQVALGVGEVGRLPGITRDVQAYESWLEARSIAGQTADDFQRAVRILESVVQRDPSFELAWLDLYGRLMTLGAFYGTDAAAARDTFAKADAMLIEGARKNPDARLLQVAREGARFIDQGYWLEGARWWDQFKPLEEEYARTGIVGNSWGWASWLVSVDKASEAVALLEQARKSDPFDGGVPIYLAEAYSNTGRPAEARAEYARGLSLTASEVLSVNALVAALGTQDATLIEQAWREVPKSDPLVRRFHELRSSRVAALEEIRRLAAASPRVVAASRLTLWAAAFGDPALAITALHEDQNRARRRITALALWRPIMRDARRLPEFKQLVKEWGFVDYWKQYGWGDHCKPVGADDFECR
jgi:TolB-like protein